MSPDDLFEQRSKARLYVMRHSGRAGERWRCVFASDDEAEARSKYFDRLPRTSSAYSATTLYRGLPPGGIILCSDGFDPTPGGSPGKGDVYKAEQELRRREDRRRERLERRRRGRIEPLRLRVAPIPAEAGTETDGIAEEEAAQTARARRTA